MQISPLTVQDYSALAVFLEQQSLGAIPKGVWLDRFACFWEKNPVKVDGVFTRGWVLKDAQGRIGGFLGSIPLRYSYKGQEILVCALTSWYVREDFRKGSLLLLSKVVQQPYRLMNTTPAPETEAIFLRLGFRSLGKDWFYRKYFLPVSRKGLASYLAQRIRCRLRFFTPIVTWPAAFSVMAVFDLRRFFLNRSKDSEDVRLEEVSFFSSQSDNLWNDLRNKYDLLAVRDACQLNWFYFSTPLLTKSRKAFVIIRSGKQIGYLGIKIVSREKANYWELVDMILSDSTPEILEAVLSQLFRIAAESSEPPAYLKMQAFVTGMGPVASRMGAFSLPEKSAMLCRGDVFEETAANYFVSSIEGDRPFFP